MKWATFFFLHYTDLLEQECETEYDLEDHYLQRFSDTLDENMEKYNDGGAKAREAGRGVMMEWHRLFWRKGQNILWISSIKYYV